MGSCSLLLTMKTAILFALVGLASAACPNGCSGNGICGANDKCSCFQNWQGPDCSLRTCPYSLAWADTADGTNSAHYYAECSNKGVCDRKTGECKCFDGYEGKGCRRSTCPEGCSGHGTCEYIDELAGDFYDRRTGPGAKFKTLSGTKQGTIVNHDAGANEQALSNSVTDSDNTRQYHGFLYQLWDAQKIQGCKCDLGYSGPDCASRVAPKGDDPLTTVKSTMGVQAIQIDSQAGDFHLVYHDPYGGVWRTDGIAASTDDAVVAKNVQDALRELPNEVLEMVTVAARSSTQTVPPHHGRRAAHPVRQRPRYRERLRQHRIHHRRRRQGRFRCHFRGQAGPDWRPVPLGSQHGGKLCRWLFPNPRWYHTRRCNLHHW